MYIQPPSTVCLAHKNTALLKCSDHFRQAHKTISTKRLINESKELFVIEFWTLIGSGDKKGTPFRLAGIV